MPRSRFTEERIAFALQQAEQRTQVAEVTRKMGISEPTFFRWKKKFGGLMPSEVRKLRQLEEENARLHRDRQRGPTELLTSLEGVAGLYFCKSWADQTCRSSKVNRNTET